MTKILNPELEFHVPKLPAYGPLQSSALGSLGLLFSRYCRIWS